MVSIAPFRFDVTPPLGHALLGGLVPSAIAIDDGLEAIGYVLLSDDAPIVVCVLDWAGLMNASHHAFRSALAAAAGTSPERVALHCVHQHNAPFVCEETRQIAAAHPELPAVFDPTFLADCLQRGAAAVRGALQSPHAITHIAHGEAAVHSVAANRRVDRDADGRVGQMRGSACTDTELIALPDGTIDPQLRTIAFYAGELKVVACHYYATHPMSYYRDGRVTSDFCGLARKRRQREDPTCTHLYFTGCAGNIAAGKYNDGTPTARRDLTNRIHAAIVAASKTLTPEPLRAISWQQANIAPSCRAVPSVEELGSTVGGPTADQVGTLLRAYWTAWQRRTQRVEPLLASCLQLNDTSVLHLPGEVFIEYQLQAQNLPHSGPVMVAAYGDGGPWYIPTAREYSKGGYETVVAFSPPSVERDLNAAIEKLLARS
jgi:hypothetical protein